MWHASGIVALLICVGPVRQMSASSPPPRRILYFVGEDYWFLLSRLPMARAARDAGLEVHVATNVNKDGKAIEAEGFILHPIPFRRGGLSPFSAIPTIQAIRRIQKKIRPDVMHAAGLQVCVYGSIATLGRSVPMINAITGLGYIFTTVNWQTRLLRRGHDVALAMALNRKSSFALVQTRMTAARCRFDHRRGVLAACTRCSQARQLLPCFPAGCSYSRL
jgi:hypothetical protein